MSMLSPLISGHHYVILGKPDFELMPTHFPNHRRRGRRHHHHHHRPILTTILLLLCFSKTKSHGKQHRVKASHRAVDYGEDHPLSRYLKHNSKKPLLRNEDEDGDEQEGVEEEEEEEQQRRGAKRLDVGPVSLDGGDLKYRLEGENGTEVEEIWTTTGSSYNVTNSTNDTVAEDVNSTEEEDLLSSKEGESDEQTVFNSSISSPGNYQPIRIRAVLTSDSGGSFLSSWERDYLLDEILSPALQSWSQSLYVIPVLGNLIVDRDQLYDKRTCGPGLDSGLPSPIVPEEHFTIGVPDTDLLVYVSLGFDRNATSNQTSGNLTPRSNASTVFPSCLSDPSILAAATYCSTDQYDRPIAGSLHICIHPREFYAPQNRRSNAVTVMHELGHVLGMNSHSLAHFRNRDGSPRTPRDESDDVKDVEVECTGSSGRKEVIPLPDPSVVSFRTVRSGVRVAQIATENVRLIARNQFNCQELPGAELQSDSCLGEHWSRSLFREELLNPVLSGMESLRPSPLTLALFWDSGWYKVNLRAVGHVSGWGRRAGCQFVERSCWGEEDNEEFCHVEGELGCTPDLSHKAVCMTDDDDSDKKDILDDDHRHFPKISKAIESCPTYVAYQNGMCNDPSNEQILRIHPMERFNVPNSRCLVGYFQKTKHALCLPIACVISDQSLRIQVDGIWQQCDYAGQRLPAKRGGYVICPDASRICPTFYCPKNCLGTNDGVCNYTSRECVCGSNKTVEFCGDNFTHPEQGEQKIFETRLSQYYVANTTLLENEMIGDVPNGFWTNTTKLVLFVIAMSLVFVVVGVLVAKKWNNTKKQQKDKVVASVLVDIRVHDPRRGLSRAARRSIDNTTMSKKKTKQFAFPWKNKSNHGVDDSLASATEMAVSRTISETTSVEEEFHERKCEFEMVCEITGMPVAHDYCREGENGHHLMDVELS